MKRILLAAIAAITVTGPLAATASADPPRYHRDYDRRDHRDHRWDDRRDHRAHQWRRGDRLPSHYRSHYREVDYRHAHLRAPPRGYHYVRDDRSGETLLVGIATGVILGVILAQ